MSHTVEMHVGSVPALGRHMAILRVNAEQEVQPESSHMVLMIDCSGSMMGSLESVKSDAADFVSEMGDTDLVSIVAFSGHGDAQMICGPVRCDETGRTMVQKAIHDRIHVIGLTVFSEPLELVLEHLKTFNDATVAHQAVLFTDGCAVPSRWDYFKESSLACGAAGMIAKLGASVSTIGYGYYYDEDFITSLMYSGRSSGIFRHVSDIEDFGAVVRDIRRTFEEVDMSSIELQVNPEGAAVERSFRVFPELSYLGMNGAVDTRGFFSGQLTVYMEVTSDFVAANINLTINKETLYKSISVGALTPEMELDCARVAAATYAVSGLTGKAIEILSELGEEGVADALQNSFTERDRRTNSDRLRRAFRDKTFIGEGLKPSGPSHCVLNVLRLLMEDDSVVMSIPAGTYKRGGLLTVDERVIPSPLGSTVEVVGYASKNDRLNFSVTTKKDVRVRPVDDEGNIIDDAEPVDSQVFRTYNIIRDGELVMSTLYASMSLETFMGLQEAGAIDPVATYIPAKSYKLELGDMKMVSSAWARPNSLQLAQLLREEKELMAEQKVLNAYIKALGAPQDDEFAGGVYRESSQVADDVPVETYTAPLVEVRLMGYKAAYVDNTVGMSVDQAVTRVKEVRRRLKTVRFISRSVIYACHLTGWQSINWGEATQAAGSEKMERTAMLGDARLKLVTGEVQVEAS